MKLPLYFAIGLFLAIASPAFATKGNTTFNGEGCDQWDKYIADQFGDPGSPMSTCRGKAPYVVFCTGLKQVYDNDADFKNGVATAVQGKSGFDLIQALAKYAADYYKDTPGACKFMACFMEFTAKQYGFACEPVVTATWRGGHAWTRCKISIGGRDVVFDVDPRNSAMINLTDKCNGGNLWNAARLASAVVDGTLSAALAASATPTGDTTFVSAIASPDDSIDKVTAVATFAPTDSEQPVLDLSDSPSVESPLFPDDASTTCPLDATASPTPLALPSLGDISIGPAITEEATYSYCAEWDALYTPLSYSAQPVIIEPVTTGMDVMTIAW